MKTTHITTRTTLLVALALVLCAAVAMAVLMPTVAQANTSEPTGALDDIYAANAATGGTFDRTNLQALLKKLIDDNSATDVTPEDVATKLGVAGNTSTTPTALSSKNIIVKFGGITWIAVALTRANVVYDATLGLTTGPSDPIFGTSATSSYGYDPDAAPNNNDVILTLWQAYADPDTDKAMWNEYYANTDKGTYPANMYGTSTMRAKVLNNGGYYATSNTQLGTPYEQDATNKYAKFNMSSYQEGGDTKLSNISKFLVSPRYIAWQKEQDVSSWPSNWTNYGKARNNQAWGRLGSNFYYTSGSTNYSYEDIDYTRQWMDDLLWLPSIRETGYQETSGNKVNYPGLWTTTAEQRSNTGTNAWLRSALDSNYYSAHFLTTDGSNYSNTVSSEYLVRPALHLNLTSAAEAANTVDKPTESQTKDVVYNGSQYTFETGVDVDLVDKKVTIQAKKGTETVALSDKGGKKVLNATEEGIYTVTVKLKDDYRWETEGTTDANPDKDDVIFTFTIHKRKVSLDVVIPSTQSSILVYGGTFAQSSDSSVYYNYKTGTILPDLESSTDYAESNYYQILADDTSQITAHTPVSDTSAFGVGKYPLYLTLGTLKDNHNYEISVHGNFTDEGGTYYEHNGTAATIEIVKRKVVINVKGSATLTYGDSFDMSAGNFWEYAAGARTDSLYAPNATYEILPKDVGKLSVDIPGTEGGGLLTPKAGGYKVSVVFDNDPNYDVTVSGSATITVNNAKFDLTDLEAFYNRIANVEYRPNLSYTLSPEMTLIRSTGVNSVQLAQLNFTATVTSTSATLSGLASSGYKVSNAGTYTLTVTITADYHDVETRTFTVTISKATPVVDYKTDRQSLIYTSQVLPDIELISATIDGLAVEGTIRWTRSLSEVMNNGDNHFTWEFTPSDLTNYNVVTGETTLNIRFVGVLAIVCAFDEGDVIFYDTDDINILKNYLTVTVSYEDGTSRLLTLNEYILTCQGNSSLIEGENVPVTASFTSGGTTVAARFEVKKVQKWQPGGGDNPGENPGDEPEEKAGWFDWIETTPLPLGYVALVLGAELLLIIILAIAARKPKKQ